MVPDQTQVHSKRLWSDLIAPEVASDQTEVRSKRLWSDTNALEITSDQTQVRSNPPIIRLFRPNWPLIRPPPDHGPDLSDQNYLWSDHLQTIVQDCSALELPSSRCNFGLEHTGVRSTGSDHKSIWVRTSTWENSNTEFLRYKKHKLRCQTFNRCVQTKMNASGGCCVFKMTRSGKK